jgi:hypothetical protein
VRRKARGGKGAWRVARLREDWTQERVVPGLFSMKSFGVREKVRNLWRGLRGGAERVAMTLDPSKKLLIEQEQMRNLLGSRRSGSMRLRAGAWWREGRWGFR